MNSNPQSPDKLSSMSTTLAPQDFFSSYQKALSELCQKYNVARLEVFGSAARQSDFTNTSDIDLLVTFKTTNNTKTNKAKHYFDLLDELEALLGRKVDLAEPSALRNPYVLKSINKDRRTIYATP